MSAYNDWIKNSYYNLFYYKFFYKKWLFKNKILRELSTENFWKYPIVLTAVAG